MLEWLKKINSGSNPELDSTYLFSTPLIPVVLLSSYAAFVLHFGPKWMKNRAPMNLRHIIVVYNLVQVLYNAWMAIQFSLVRTTWTVEKNLGCVVNLEPSDNALFRQQHAYGFWHFAVNKILDLFDTVFFVLTKKQNHVTFLHVHHHIVMVMNTWFFGKYAMTSEGNFMAYCNMIVHAIMYFYYFLAALGPKYQKYLWWKRYMTQIQITQFVAIIIFNMIAMYRCGENYNYLLHYVIVGEAMVNFCLFARFYAKSYKNADKKMSKKD
ncbi:very long chain fatty acid elongase 7-like [Culicoides brevitarsis]|uniref:very long chain fatty acid elongase 7-like n=1 Tax=Culicoides brevitarsis TaxID=469753 RepID=UPI00307B8009